MKKLIWVGMFTGSAVGGFIPTLWGTSGFSFASIIFSALGAFAGIYFAYRIAR